VLTQGDVARQTVSAACTLMGTRHRATAGRRVSGICLPLHSYEASNLPVERARGAVGADVQLGDRAAHRPVRRPQSRMRSSLRLGAGAVAALVVCVGCSSPEPQFHPGDRRVVSIAGLEAFKSSEAATLRDFAARHTPFWKPTGNETADCERLLASSSLLAGLRAPLSNYHLQFAGVSLNSERLVLVHGFCPQGPETASFTRFGGELVFLPYHWGTCYFEAYCALEKRQVRGVTFSTKGR
jgi:hypothetical protein